MSRNSVLRGNNSLESPRMLQEQNQFEVTLYPELQFVDESTASALEQQSGGVVSSHVCDCMKAQEALNWNATIVVNDLPCRIFNSSRIYDDEAMGIFGPGHLSFQLQVVQTLRISSTQSLSQDVVSGIVESGFEVASGGQRELLDCLHTNDAFGTVLSIDMRGGLSPSEKQPTMAPTRHPTGSPTTSTTQHPTNTPTSNPTVSPTRLPTESPTTTPTQFLTAAPSHLPTFIPTQTPTKGHSTNPTPTPTSIEDKTSGSNPSRRNGVMSDPILLAAIVLSVLMCFISSTLICCWWKVLSILKREPQRDVKFALTSRDGQLIRDKSDMIPGIVELDQRSLAETTLGENTATTPHKLKATKAAPRTIRPLESFDENSLYTTPNSVRQIDSPNPSVRNQNQNDFPRHQQRQGASSPSHCAYPSEPRIESHDLRRKTQIADERVTMSDQTRNLEPVHSPESSKASSQPDPEEFVDFPDFEDNDMFDGDVWSCEFEEFSRHIDDMEPWHEPQTISKTKGNKESERQVVHPLKRRITPLRRRQDPPPENSTSNFHGTSETSDTNQKSRILDTVQVEKNGHSNTPPAHDSPQAPGSAVPTTPTKATMIARKQMDAHGRLASSTARRTLAQIIESVSKGSTTHHMEPTDPPVADGPDEPSIPLDTSKDDSTLLGLQFKDEESSSSSSESTAVSPNPWLFGKVEDSLGPISPSADLESLSGKSNLSARTPNSRSKTESMVSFGSKASVQTGFTNSEISFARHNLQRQLASLESDQVSTSTGISSVTGASFAKRKMRAPKLGQRKRMVVMVPAGKLGVVLANHHDGRGTVVSEIRGNSPLLNLLTRGDQVIAIDDEDVTGMVVSQITSLMASRAHRERRLTIITTKY
eukprot:Nitzschia sp. Nitz4//scaffold15_size197535//139408//142123//NITZ4_001596-RA/size197535-processed-gene-0.306-mRNA-1//-1//CDS//3329537769//4615//frame0